MKTKNEIGIITYHAAYNFGSVLQAFATQTSIQKIGFNTTTIINYRPKEQKRVYKMYRWSCNIKQLIKNIMLLSLHQKRKKRAQRFEDFIRTYLQLSKEFSNPAFFERIASSFDVLVSGSDQIWNKHSLEMDEVDWKYMKPYLLHGVKVKKISYASSIANMSDEELLHLKDDLDEFNHISVRESHDTIRLKNIYKGPVSWVVDPTFLLTKSDWIYLLNLKKKNSERYLLFYSLSLGYTELHHHLKALKQYAQKRGLHIKVVNHNIVLKTDNIIEQHADWGPREFLEALYNAEVIVTDSYHGTILSINFNKVFFCICGTSKSENRKKDILTSLGLESRRIPNIDAINEVFPIINYNQVNDIIKIRRDKSLSYLKANLIG